MDKKEAKALLDTSAEKNRNLLTAFVLFMVTTSALVLSITDMDLLSGNKSIPLPLLAVDLPIYIFYVFLPALLLALHFNLLQNVQEHRAKLEEWLKSLPPNIPANTGQHLFPFIYDVAIVRNRIHSTLGNRLVAFAVWLLYVYLPFLTLSLFLVWFADLQEMITLYHLVLLVLDGWLLWLFRYRPTASADKKTATSPTEWLGCIWQAVRFIPKWFRQLWQTILLIPTQPSRLLQAARLMTSWLWQLLRWLWRYKLRVICSVALAIHLSIVLFFWGVIQCVSEEWAPEEWAPDYERLSLWTAIQRLPTEPKTSLLSLVQAANRQAGDVQTMSYEWFLPRINVPKYYHPYTVSEDAVRISLWAAEAEQRKECEDADKSQTEQPENAKDGSKTPAEPRKPCQDSIKIDKLAAWNNSPRPLDLRGRRLLFASLPANQLRRVDLSKADLRGADLREARLQDADLMGTQLQRAYLSSAQLQGADLGRAQLQGADLWQAQLQGANLSWAQLQGADLWQAQLQGAILRVAQLQGANLWQAQLQGASLDEAQLQGANLFQAQVRGVEWREAQLGGTYVKEIDKKTKFDFGTVASFPYLNLVVDPDPEENKRAWQKLKQHQAKPPALPTPFGTINTSVFARTWLSLLCSPVMPEETDLQEKAGSEAVRRSTLAMMHSMFFKISVHPFADTVPYTAIKPTAIVDRLKSQDCQPYAEAVHKEYSYYREIKSLAEARAKAEANKANAPTQRPPKP